MSEKLINHIQELVPELIAAVIIFIGGHIIMRVTLSIMKRTMNLKHVDITVHKFLMSVTRAVIMILTIIICLSVLKVPMASIIAAISAAGLAIGLALQNSLSNIAGGFIILFTKPLKYGDYVKIGSDEGTVEAISILYTVLKTVDGKVIFIPNGNVSKSSIVNMTKDDKRLLVHKFQISYSDDYHKAKEIIKGVLINEKYVLDKPEAPVVCMSAHNESSVEILVKVWIPSEKYLFAKSDLLEKVTDAFNVNGITIPFKQIDLHIPKDIKLHK